VSTRAGWQVVGSSMGRWLVLMARDTHAGSVFERQWSSDAVERARTRVT